MATNAISLIRSAVGDPMRPWRSQCSRHRLACCAWLYWQRRTKCIDCSHSCGAPKRRRFELVFRSD